MAVSKTSEVMGITLNNIMCRDDLLIQYGDEDMDKISKYNEIEIFLDKVRKNSDIYEKYPNVDKIMELKIISVNEAYRRQGVCKALINKSKYLYQIYLFKNIIIYGFFPPKFVKHLYSYNLF